MFRGEAFMRPTSAFHDQVRQILTANCGGGGRRQTATVHAAHTKLNLLDPDSRTLAPMRQVAMAVADDSLRPSLPDMMHPGLMDLLQACFAPEPEQRPSFAMVHSPMHTLTEPCPVSPLPMPPQQRPSFATMEGALSHSSFSSASGIIPVHERFWSNAHR